MLDGVRPLARVPVCAGVLGVGRVPAFEVGHLVLVFLRCAVLVVLGVVVFALVRVVLALLDSFGRLVPVAVVVALGEVQLAVTRPLLVVRARRNLSLGARLAVVVARAISLFVHLAAWVRNFAQPVPI